MKAWILAAVVAGVLVLVGVPAVALTVASHGTGGRSATAEPKKDDSDQGWGPPGWAHRHGHGHPPFALDKLSPKQRNDLADRLDQRAARLHKAAACLRQNSDPKTCLKDTFRPDGFSRPPRQG